MAPVSHSWSRAVLALTALLFVDGCSEDCNHDEVYPIYRVVVVDQSTGQALCDANVSLGAGGQRAPASTIDCSYVLNVPNGESTTITATHDGFTSASVQVTTKYPTDECNKPEPIEVTIELTPLAGP
jgi:hypothetical protein